MEGEGFALMHEITVLRKEAPESYLTPLPCVATARRHHVGWGCSSEVLPEWHVQGPRFNLQH
jgi:hypothetical protein